MKTFLNLILFISSFFVSACSDRGTLHVLRGGTDIDDQIIGDLCAVGIVVGKNDVEYMVENTEKNRAELLAIAARHRQKQRKIGSQYLELVFRLQEEGNGDKNLMSQIETKKYELVTENKFTIRAMQMLSTLDPHYLPIVQWHDPP